MDSAHVSGPRRLTGGESPSHNLPGRATSFVGRVRERAEVSRALRRSRLVTVTGPGGVGKTRLALQVAADALPRFPDGVWLVELEHVDDPALVPQSVGSALGIHGASGQTWRDTLLGTLHPRQLLLVLDTCEHVLAACRDLAEAILETCPGVQILATSRQPMWAGGEVVWKLGPFATPAPDTPVHPTRLVQFDAVRLFTERAVAARSTFVLTPENAPAVAAICRELEGIPLGLELAAARLKVLAAEQVARQLADRLGFSQTTGPEAVAPRHQSLWAMLDWSYDLLSDAEQGLWRRLSVFAGGCSLEAVEAVQPDDTAERSTLDVLAGLIDSSLVQAEEDPPGQMRFSLLETVRQYGLAQLQRMPERATVCHQHLSYFLHLAEQADRGLKGAEQASWLRRLDQELGNLRASLRWAMETRDSGTALRLSAALKVFWEVRGYVREGLSWLEAGLAASEGDPVSPLRAKALSCAGGLARLTGDSALAEARYEAAIHAYRHLGDPRALANAFGNLAVVFQERGSHARARVLYEQSLALRRETGDDWGTAAVLNNLGTLALDGLDYAAARTCFTESLSLWQQIGDQRCIAVALSNMGILAYVEGLFDDATSLLRLGLAHARELGDALTTARCLMFLGLVARAQGNLDHAWSLCLESFELVLSVGDLREAATRIIVLAGIASAGGTPAPAAVLFGAAERLREGIAMPIPAVLASQYLRDHTTLRAAIDEEVYAAGWARGRSLGLKEAATYARAISIEHVAPDSRRSSPIPVAQLGLLTAREQEVAAQVAGGLTNRQIADRLVISKGTAGLHVKNILRKLGFGSRAQIAAWAVEQGLPSMPAAPTDIPGCPRGPGATARRRHLRQAG